MPAPLLPSVQTTTPLRTPLVLLVLTRISPAIGVSEVIVRRFPLREKLIPGSEELNEKFDSTPLVSVSVTVYRVPSYLSS